MTAFTNFEAVSILLLIANGILMPITLYYVASGKQARTAGFEGLVRRLDHLDACLGSLRLTVAGTGITRPEFDARIVDLRKEMQDEFTKQAVARHDLATRTQVLVDAVEERLTRRLERVESSTPPPGRLAPAAQGG